MKRSKKALAAALAAVMLLPAVISGCSAKPADSSSAAASQGEASSTGGASGETFKFSYTMQNKFIDWLKEDKWYPYALKATNTEVELISGGTSESEYQSGIDQQIISQSFPDAGIVTATQANVYGTQGAFLDLKPLIEKYAPNIKAYLDANPDYAKYVTADNGAIYGLASESPRIAEVLFYRADMFKKAGITNIPTTADEFLDTCRQLKAYYGKSDPNYYPLSGREHYIRFQSAFNCYANFDGGVAHGLYDTQVLKESGTDIYSEGYKKMIEWYATMYKEGLINPEWVNGSMTEELWQTDMLTGKSSIAFDFYTRPAWFMINGGPTNDPAYDIQVMDYLKDMKGNPAMMTVEARYKTDRSIVINTKSEAKAEGILKFLDYFFTKEGQTLVQWGVEGESYKVENGKNAYLVDFSKEEATAAGTPRWSFLNDRLTFPKPIDNEAFYQWNTKLVADAALKLFPTQTQPAVLLTFSTDDAKEYDNIKAVVRDAVMAETTKFVTGKRDFSQWDQFLSEMEAKGYKKMVAIQQKAYDAQYK